MTEALVCGLQYPEEAQNLTEGERAAIAYADLAATNHLMISDEIFTRPPGLASFIGFGRMGAAFNVLEGLPERFQVPAGETVTPWARATSSCSDLGGWD